MAGRSGLCVAPSLARLRPSSSSLSHSQPLAACAVPSSLSYACFSSSWSSSSSSYPRSSAQSATSLAAPSSSPPLTLLRRRAHALVSPSRASRPLATLRSQALAKASSMSTSASNGAPPPLTEISSLSNGMRVASQYLDSPWCCINLILPIGPRYETAENAGNSYFIEKMAFKGTQTRDREELEEAMGSVGGFFAAVLNRESLMFSCNAFLEDAERAVELMADVVLRPKYTEEDLSQQIALELENRRDIADKHQMLMPDLLHNAAYGSHTLGRTQLPPLDHLSNITPDTLATTHGRFFHPSRMVLSGAGIPHHVLARLGEKFFGQGGRAEALAVEKPTFTGGDVRHEMEESPSKNALRIPLSQLSFGFQGCGWSEAGMVPVTVLQTLLGGGDSFSAGGPGKGMYSLLYTNCLNVYPWMNAAQAMHASYSDAGIFSVSCACPPEAVEQGADVLLSNLLSTVNYVAEADLKRAKNMLKGLLLMNLEGLPLIAEDICRQVLFNGKRLEADSLCRTIDAVTTRDVRDLLRTMLRGPLAVGALGNVAALRKSKEIEEILRYHAK